MKLTFIGVGSAFTRTNFHSAIVAEITRMPPVGYTDPPTTYRLLIDCGRTTPEAMTAAGLTWHDFDGLYVSHLHNDHIGAVEEFAFMRFFVPKGLPKPFLFGNEKLIQDLWEQSLRGGLASLEGRICTLDTYFNVQRVPMNDDFTFGGVKFTPIQMVHIQNGYGFAPSYGLLFKTPNGKKVFITTDAQFAPNQIMWFYNHSDVIFQDCETYDWQNGKLKSGVHAHYTDLKTLPPEIKAKMWLYHYQDGDLPDAKADGFAGFVKKGQTFEL